VRWKCLSSLIVISVFWPLCCYPQSRPARPGAPAEAGTTADGTFAVANGRASTSVVADNRSLTSRPVEPPGAGSGAAGAAVQESASPINPQLKADILHLFALMHVMQELQGAAQARLGSMRPNFVRMLPDTPHREQIADELLGKLKALITSHEFEDSLVAVYAKYFNDGQVRGLIQIYQSPAWQHYMTVEGSLMEDSRRAGEEFTIERSPAIYAGLCLEYPELQGKAKFCPAVPAGTSAPKGQP